ncbi:hypothetical protein E2C01_053494 [Portunus trituberculatus]|uniref:Uncharacterized protein n=1 Tax=Portunus trituberculatus TaxID=210409 RepID=A0A5B7GPW5_PORTR|nr:hypothetical protein [Portunus trituberculatus]
MAVSGRGVVRRGMACGERCGVFRNEMECCESITMLRGRQVIASLIDDVHLITRTNTTTTITITTTTGCKLLCLMLSNFLSAPTPLLSLHIPPCLTRLLVTHTAAAPISVSPTLLVHLPLSFDPDASALTLNSSHTLNSGHPSFKSILHFPSLLCRISFFTLGVVIR